MRRRSRRRADTCPSRTPGPRRIQSLKCKKYTRGYGRTSRSRNPTHRVYSPECKRRRLRNIDRRGSCRGLHPYRLPDSRRPSESRHLPARLRCRLRRRSKFRRCLRSPRRHSRRHRCREVRLRYRRHRSPPHAGPPRRLHRFPPRPRCRSRVRHPAPPNGGHRPPSTSTRKRREVQLGLPMSRGPDSPSRSSP
jgi:hypothetical protein